jgi:ribosomal protein S18 acetylase RimI-like enzyme
VSSPLCTASVRDLETVAALGWRPTETARLGGWLLRAAGGFTGRANSALPLGDPGRPAVQAVHEVAAWYRSRGLRPRFLLPLPDAGPLDALLADAGWLSGDVVRVLVAPLGPLLPAQDAPAVRIDSAPDDAWVAAYHYRGGALPANARTVLAGGDLVGFASVRAHGESDGAVLAIARGCVDPAADGTRWLGVTAVEVDPAARRQGLAGATLRGLAGWAADQGAACCYLQVAADNAPALALYTGAGFTEHHTYQYRLAPDASV